MVTLGAAAVGSWLSPAAIAKAAGGRVVRTGLTALRLVTDSRQAGRDAVFLALRGEHFDGHDFVPSVLRSGAAGVVVQGALAGRLPPGDGFVVRVPDTGRALLDLARAHRERHPARVVGITGSCGKTSTKDMLGWVLSTAMPAVWSPKSFNNHVGVPLSLLAIRPDSRAAVVEIGTNAPGEIGALTRVAQPDIGIITCIREAHLEGLGSLAGVAEEKASLFAGLRPGGIAVLNGDDRACAEIGARLDVPVRFYRIDREADWFATDVVFHGLGTSFLLQGERPVTLPRLGSHNVHNALACVAAAVELGMAVEDVVAALSRLPMSARRLEPKSVGGVQIFDDTYNMNPASARAALHALAGIDTRGRKFAVFGEMLELGPRSVDLHRELGDDVVRSGIDRLITIGAGAGPIADGAIAAGFGRSRVTRISTASEALEALLADLAPGDLVLCKASRAVALDRLVDDLHRALSSAGNGACGVPGVV